MGVELGRGIAIDRTGGVVLELGRDELPGGLGGVVAADPRLGVPLQLGEGVVTASRWASRTRSSPPTRAVSETDFGAENVASQPARCSTGFTVVPSAVVYSWPLRCRTNCSPVRGFCPSTETGEVLRVDGAGKAIVLGQLALPLAKDGVALLPIVLLGGRELFGVIRLRLAGAERFGDSQHGRPQTRSK